jgi:hypothetical protein
MRALLLDLRRPIEQVMKKRHRDRKAIEFREPGSPIVRYARRRLPKVKSRVDLPGYAKAEKK